MGHCAGSSSRPRNIPRRQTRTTAVAIPILGLLAASLPAVMAQQQCIPLRGSTTCPAFSNASISTSAPYSFLAFVSDVQSFDEGLRAYVETDYARRQYQERIGCSSVDLSNTTDIYARYTTSVLCNFIVQASIGPCNLGEEESTPLCAPSCGEYAISEQEITSTPELCGTPGDNAIDIIRADYQDCSVPARALSGACIEAADNEPAECGFQNNLPGLCSFCGQSTPNATDSCCVNANVESRCKGVDLPETSSMPPLVLPTGTPSGTATPTPGSAARSKEGLSGGAIAGIVIGSIVGAALILAIVIVFCVRARKKRDSRGPSVLNTPSPTRQNIPGPQMAFHDGASPTLAGARVARMSALEQASTSDRHSSRAGGVMGAYHDPRDDAYSSPDSGRSHLSGHLPKRDGSLSSSSVLAAMDDHSSPHSGSNTDRNFSSPEGVASGQSEQLQFFKDYYSQDDIHPNDTVATLWAYQPRANDEFELERGDMLKVVGIWDDGWATGVRINETAEQWEARKQLQRDSGVSNGSRQSRGETENEIKAFPLVCVCLPQHWRKTIEGDSTETGGVASSSSPSPVPSIEPIQLAPLRVQSPLDFPARKESRKTAAPPVQNHSRGSSTLINSPRRI